MSRSTANSKERFNCLFLVLLCMTHKLASVIIFSYGSFWAQKKCVFGLYNLRENETGFGQDNNMMFKNLLFCSPFPIVLLSSFLYHNKLIDLSKVFTLFHFLFSFFSVLYFFKTLNVVQNFHILPQPTASVEQGFIPSIE